MTPKCKIYVAGGLGNQLFQYAAFLYLRKKFNDCQSTLNFALFYQWESHYGIEIDKIFKLPLRTLINIKYAEIVRRKLPAFFRAVHFKMHLIELKFGKYKNIEIDYNNPRQQLSQYLNKNVVRLLFNGYFQDYDMVNEVHDQIMTCFKGKQDLGNDNIELISKYANREICSLHIRRGDYLKSEKLNVFNTLDYYTKSISYLKEHVNNPVFFVFSDDIEWVKRNLIFDGEREYVDWNTSDKSYRDLLLMTQCNHNIIANSTFSWWGAYLNGNKDKIVIYPEKWMTDTDTKQLFPSDWVKMLNN